MKKKKRKKSSSFCSEKCQVITGRMIHYLGSFELCLYLLLPLHPKDQNCATFDFFDILTLLKATPPPRWYLLCSTSLWDGVCSQAEHPDLVCLWLVLTLTETHIWHGYYRIFRTISPGALEYKSHLLAQAAVSAKPTNVYIFSDTGVSDTGTQA